MHPLVISGLTKAYGAVAALRGFDLRVASGEIVTLLGPSGCGKTTTLRLIAGFEPADAGLIQIAGQTVMGPGVYVPPERRGVGMVFQDYALFPHLTVAENVAFGLSGGGRSARVNEMLSLVGLAGLGSRFPHELSGGQQQRVALARALAPRPAVVLLDEPFSNLDASLRLVMRDEVRRVLKESGATAIFVTHDQADALAISDRVAVMNGGRLEQIDSPRLVYQQPATPFVASFFGQTNLLEGRAVSGGVETQIGLIPCQARGDVTLSIRPGSFVLDPSGPLCGEVRRCAYAGQCTEVEVAVGDTRLHLCAHPDAALEVGQTVRFKAIPDFVSVIEG